MKIPRPFTFETDCVSSDGESIRAMVDAPEQRQITIGTFARHVDIREAGRMLGYDRNLPLRRDWHVSYHRSIYRGRRCYYLRWSGIEHIFTRAEDRRAEVTP